MPHTACLYIACFVDFRSTSTNRILPFKMATVVLPGDSVRSLPSTTQARLGPGVQQVMPSNKSSSSKAEDSASGETQIASIRAGLLGSQPGKETAATGAASESIWVESRMKRVRLQNQKLRLGISKADGTDLQCAI